MTKKYDMMVMMMTHILGEKKEVIITLSNRLSSEPGNKHK